MNLALTPKLMYDEIVACTQAGLVPNITASPGVGKSALVRKFTKEYGLKLIDLRLSQCMPEDLNGFPKIITDPKTNVSIASYVPFDVFPLESTPLPRGYQGWCIFLDEITSATKPVQAAAYKLILDRMVGNHKLHPNVVLVAAGNKSTDRAVVNQMSSALQSRMINYFMEPSVTDWTEIAVQEKFDSRVIAFVNQVPERLMRFEPEKVATQMSYPCPRTHEFLSRLIIGMPDLSMKHLSRVAGCIGEGTAVEFITFVEQSAKMPTMADILANPLTTPVPVEASTKYATMFMLIGHGDETNIIPILDYIKKFGLEQQIVFCRSIHAKDRTLVEKSRKFADYVNDMLKYMS